MNTAKADRTALNIKTGAANPLEQLTSVRAVFRRQIADNQYPYQKNKRTTMTVKYFILTIIMGLATTGANAQVKLFEKYEEVKGVETVFISKTLLSMASGGNIGNKEISKVAKKLDEVRILSCEKPALAKKIREEAAAIYKGGQYEQLMRMNDDGEKVIIYARKLSGKYEYALFCYEKDEVEIINLVGNLTLEELKRIAD